MGRLERRKTGIYNLLRALVELERDDWTLTILGGDIRPAPWEARCAGCWS